MTGIMQVGMIIGAVLASVVLLISIVVEATCRFLPYGHKWFLDHDEPPIPFVIGLGIGVAIVLLCTFGVVLIPCIIIIGSLIFLGKFLAQNVISKYRIEKIEE
jgi:hypothetical protein